MTMTRLLNEHTGTVHKSRQESPGDEAVCGALRHVSGRHVASVPNDEPRTNDAVDRCGRCFEDAGGY
ncbi:hypothetical protein [Halorussus halobius]|uniref:hypothetical protein n=1 Tax=Halorussus halobius TaxID=1710537 RepID=UPI001091D290|nr:hypothetical protein [Halorussus halobius]